MFPQQRPPPKPPNKHTTPRRRNRIIAATAAGQTASQIAINEGIPKTLVYGVRRRFKHQDWGVSPKGRGRPRKDSNRQTKTATAGDPSISDSPDLGPIENLWKRLKGRICARDPSLVHAPENEASLQRLRNVVVDVWDEKEQNLIDDRIQSMPCPLQIVVDAHGWSPRY